MGLGRQLRHGKWVSLLERWDWHLGHLQWAHEHSMESLATAPEVNELGVVLDTAFQVPDLVRDYQKEGYSGGRDLRGGFSFLC